MPGFNQRGPMDDGPMTGRGKGTCAPGNSGQGFANQGNMGENFRGFGRCLGKRGRGYGQWTTPAQDFVNQDTLQNRIDMLEAELSAIKNQLKNQS